MLTEEDPAKLSDGTNCSSSIHDKSRCFLDRSMPLHERYEALNNLLDNKDGQEQLPDLLPMLEDGVLKSDAVYQIGRLGNKPGINRIFEVQTEPQSSYLVQEEAK